ncbi:3-dehydroquinate synthase [Candidatus Kaiserbacteria bacterium]|nr:3-dehydroquinate synthase [Candidatus Kaiserbacteria bacterium]
MTRTVHVKTKHTSYPIIVGEKLERELAAAVKKEGARRVAVIADNTVVRILGTRIMGALKKAGIRAELFPFPAGERNKTQEMVTKLQHQMLKKKFGRDSLIIALGGGVTGDLAGFVAATYMRGIPYIQAPTTLLAMVDSSIGGKVGINTPFGKNTVGAFWQPRAVIADIAFLQYLSRKEFVNGLFEAIKTFLTSDALALNRVRGLDIASPFKTKKLLQEIIHRSISIKAGITERDERESGERLVVNFGHTIGHAIELLSRFKISHGYSVGYGMLVESKISELLGFISHSEYESIRNALAELGIQGKKLSQFSIASILETAKTDKKSKGGVPHYVLLSGIGSVHKKGGMYAHPVSAGIVTKAFNLCRQGK